MPLTTVARGRVYDWSHSVGRGAASRTGFNYPQTMCLGKGGVVYVANRGNEIILACVQIKYGLAPLAKRSSWQSSSSGAQDGRSTWPFGVAVDSQENVYLSDEWQNTISGSIRMETSCANGGTGSGDGELLRPAGLVCEKNGNVIVVDSGNNRLQVFSPDGKFWPNVARGGTGDGEFNQPWGSPSTTMAISGSPTGRTTVCKNYRHRVSS